jgi:hypothetical protein
MDRDPMPGLPNELEIESVRDFIFVDIETIEIDLMPGIFVPAAVTITWRDAHGELACRHQDHRRSVPALDFLRGWSGGADALRSHEQDENYQ